MNLMAEISFKNVVFSSNKIMAIFAESIPLDTTQNFKMFLSTRKGEPWKQI